MKFFLLGCLLLYLLSVDSNFLFREEKNASISEWLLLLLTLILRKYFSLFLIQYFDFHPLKYLNFPLFFIGRSPTTYSSSSTATKEESDLQTAQRKTFHSKQSNLPRLSSTDGLAENFSQVVQMQGTNFEVMPTFTWVWDEKNNNIFFG